MFSTLKFRVLWFAAALLMAVGLGGGGAWAQGYTPPTGLVPSEVSSTNLVAIFTQIMTNPAVLTLILTALAGGLFAAVWRAVKRARSA